jgi:hypothetical protein
MRPYLKNQARCGHSYSGGGGRKITLRGQPKPKCETLSEKQTKSNRTGLKWYFTYLASSKPWGQLPVQKKKTKNFFPQIKIQTRPTCSLLTPCYFYFCSKPLSQSLSHILALPDCFLLVSVSFNQLSYSCLARKLEISTKAWWHPRSILVKVSSVNSHYITSGNI